MKRTSNQALKSLVSGAVAAMAITFASTPAAFAGDTYGLQTFLAHPASYTAMSDGLTGPVTSASMVDDKMAVQFVIPTHAGDTVGEYIGKVDANGFFVGQGVLTPEHGDVRKVEVVMFFENNGSVLASVDGDTQASGFVPSEMNLGF